MASCVGPLAPLLEPYPPPKGKKRCMVSFFFGNLPNSTPIKWNARAARMVFTPTKIQQTSVDFRWTGHLTTRISRWHWQLRPRGRELCSCQSVQSCRDIDWTKFLSAGSAGSVVKICLHWGEQGIIGDHQLDFLKVHAVKKCLEFMLLRLPLAIHDDYLMVLWWSHPVARNTPNQSYPPMGKQK